MEGPECAVGERALLCRVGGLLCALPLEHLVETMRPLAVQPLAGSPPFVRGLAVIRGAPLPVVDAAMLLGGSDGAATRFVTLKTGSRHVALAVGEVVGVRALPAAELHALPPLAGEMAAEAVAAIGAADEALLVVLRSARLVPDATWAALERAGAA
jgi:purine-binding chemotaxis protein CheW